MTSQLFTVNALVEHAAAQYADATAITDGPRSVSFAGLREAAIAGGQVLAAQGISRGDRVGVCMEKTLDQAVAILSVLLADAILVPILPTLKRENIEHIVRDSGMAAAVVDEAQTEELRDAAPGLPLLLGSDLTAHRDAPSSAVPALPSRSIGSDVAGIIYSSGSTGRPKGIMVTHRNLSDGARITAQYLGTRQDDRIGSVLSLNFDYGLNQLWQALLTGARLFLHQLVFPDDLFNFIAQERITVLPLMPAMVTQLFNPRLLRRQPTGDLSSVRYISSSGGAVSGRMIEQLTQTFPRARLFLMYGLTEAFRSTYLDPEQVSRRPHSIGRAIPDVEILVLDDEGREVRPGERGELVHRGGCIAKGYWNAPDKTAERFRSLPRFPGETVVFSGDIVTRDEEGYLYFVGRRDSMIKTWGFRVSPTEVEDVAVRFPAIDSCVAVGLPNIEITEEIALVYTSASPVDKSDIRRFLKDRLPSHMMPRALVRWPSLPTTGNEGKIDRQAVREQLLPQPPAGQPA